MKHREMDHHRQPSVAATCELRSLTPVAFKLRHATPIIVVAGAYTKNGVTANQPIRKEFAAELIEWLRGKPKGAPVWPGEWRKKAAEMLRVDLKAAKVAFRTDRGVLDFHAIRATYITGLARAALILATLSNSLGTSRWI